MIPRRNRWLPVAVFLLVVVGLNLLATKLFFRLDLTAQKEFTLSSSTKKMLKGLGDVATVTVYFSRNLPPQLLQLRAEVEDLLKEFQSYAGKELRVEYINPDEDAELQKKLVMMGIPPLTMDVIQKDKRELATIFLGIAIKMGERQEVIRAVQSERNLEYELVAALTKVVQKETPAVGWFATEEFKLDTLDKKEDGLGDIRIALQKRYVVKDLSDDMKAEWDTASISSIILFVGKPVPQLSAKLKGYLEKGGKIFAMVEPTAVDDGLGATPREGDFSELFKSYGIEVEKKLTLDQVSGMASFRGGIVSYQINYPYWPEMRDVDHQNPITSNLEGFVLPWTAPLKLTPQENQPITVLAKTSRAGVTEEVTQPMSLDPGHAREAVLTGKQESSPLVALSGNLVVVGTTRFAWNNFLRQFPANRIFFENVVDYLSLGEGLIGIRSRGATSRPIAELTDNHRTLIKTVDMVVGPLILLLIGMIVYFLRRNYCLTLRTVYGSKGV